MTSRSKVIKGQAKVRFKLQTTESSIDLRDATISEHMAYRIYKMILDDQGKSGDPDLEAIFGSTKLQDAIPEHPASVTADRGMFDG